MSAIRDRVALVKSLYVENDFPSDRLIKSRHAMRAFTIELNRRASASYRDEEVASEIERIRKDKLRTGGLPRLGRSHSGPKFCDRNAE